MNKNEIVIDGEVISDPLKVTLKKPVTFEGKEYSEIDLSALESWTCDDVIKVQKQFKKLNAESLSATDAILLESNVEYCVLVAVRATGLPVEFFKRLPAKEGNKIKNAVAIFFNNED
jgi:hypothetical protein